MFSFHGARFSFPPRCVLCQLQALELVYRCVSEDRKSLVWEIEWSSIRPSKWCRVVNVFRPVVRFVGLHFAFRCCLSCRRIQRQCWRKWYSNRATKITAPNSQAWLSCCTAYCTTCWGILSKKSSVVWRSPLCDGLSSRCVRALNLFALCGKTGCTLRWLCIWNKQFYNHGKTLNGVFPQYTRALDKLKLSTPSNLWKSSFRRISWPCATACPESTCCVRAQDVATGVRILKALVWFNWMCFSSHPKNMDLFNVQWQFQTWRVKKKST